MTGQNSVCGGGGGTISSLDKIMWGTLLVPYLPRRDKIVSEGTLFLPYLFSRDKIVWGTLFLPYLSRRDKIVWGYTIYFFPTVGM